MLQPQVFQTKTYIAQSNNNTKKKTFLQSILEELFSILKNAYRDRDDYRFFLLKDCKRNEWPDIENKINSFLERLPTEHISEIQFGDNRMLRWFVTF